MYSAIQANKRNTIIIMFGFFVLVSGLGWLFSQIYGSPTILYGTLIGVTIYTIFQYFAAARLAVAANGAHEIQKKDNPRFWRIVENLSITDGLPMPRVYIIDDPAPNAFATGRDPQHALVCATTGILDIMDDSELESVMAHELGHVQNYDIRVMMIVFGLASAIGLLADFFLRMLWFGGNDRRETPPIFYVFGIVAAILAPIVATLVQLAVSRQREYLADATSAKTTRYPDGLISALQKLELYGKPMKRQNSSTAHLFFANPLKKGALTSLFSTHPPIKDRIARLQDLGRHM